MRLITLFLCGDVMTGRGIDQILPHPSDPALYEPYIKDARRYVRIAEQVTGSIPETVDVDYPWGEALDVLKQHTPDVRIINLETGITTSDEHWPGKGIHYRMHPGNVPVLNAAGIDVCSLANNHVLDWSSAGLAETIQRLEQAGIHHTGAGANVSEAAAQARVSLPEKGRVLVFGLGVQSSGIPPQWAATPEMAGVHLLPDLSRNTVHDLGEQIQAVKQPDDLVVASIHWGANWGYHIPGRQRTFAHRLIDSAGVDLIHGHSSHHAKGIEVYHGKLILYGCGDFINDYEGIGGYEQYRSDLGLMYFPEVDAATGDLVRLEMVPTRIEHFQVHLASSEEVVWLRDMLNREGNSLGTRVTSEDGLLVLHWEE